MEFEQQCTRCSEQRPKRLRMPRFGRRATPANSRRAPLRESHTDHGDAQRVADLLHRGQRPGKSACPRQVGVRQHRRRQRSDRQPARPSGSRRHRSGRAARPGEQWRRQGLPPGRRHRIAYLVGRRLSHQPALQVRHAPRPNSAGLARTIPWNCATTTSTRRSLALSAAVLGRVRRALLVRTSWRSLARNQRPAAGS